MFKKIIILLILSISVFTLFSCENEVKEEGEYVVKDLNLLNKTDIDDNNRVFYEIFTGAFSDSNSDGLGDLQGIINRLDYLNDGNPNSGKSLGIGGIWLTPIFESPSYHKYDVANYYKIDPEFGNMEDLKTLIKECHNRDIKLIIDLVINHTSTENEWFINFKNAHINNDTESIYYDFYSYVSAEEVNVSATYNSIAGTNIKYECNFSPVMPELNFDNELVREKIIEIAKYYLEMGIDGFRLDAAKYVYFGDDEKSSEFWSWFVSELKNVKEEVYLVGEVWDSDTVIDKYVDAGLNCFNFQMAQYEGYIASTTRSNSVTRYVNYIDYFYTKHPNATFHPFIANHDTDRAAGYLKLDNGTAYMAANLYILTPGSPFLYYGEEIGMTGSREPSAHTDANRRLAMLWGDGDTVKDPEGTTYDSSEQLNGTVLSQLIDSNSLYNHYKKLIMIRNANPEIARGEFTPLKSSNDKIGGFISTYNNSSVCVIHNTGYQEITVDLSELNVVDFTILKSYIGLNSAKLDGTLLTIGAQTTVILK